MKKKLVILLAVLGIISGCGEKDDKKDSFVLDLEANPPISEQTLPIVEEKIEFDALTLILPNTAPAMEDKWLWKKMESLTNVKMNWQEMSGNQFIEQFQLMVASGTMPELFYQAHMGTNDLEELINGGYAIPLDELIENYAPNLKALFEKYPEVKRDITWSDGNIYSLPHVDLSHEGRSMRTYINQTYLDNLGLDVPETMEEFNHYLKMVKENDANGNGDPNDEVPMGQWTSWVMDQPLYGAYGLANRGLQGLSAGIDADENGNVRFIYAQEEYKLLLKQLNEWHENGYFFEDGKTQQIEGSKWQAMDKANQIGSFAWANPGLSGGKEMEKYVAVSALEGPNGDKILNWLDPITRAKSVFVLTSQAKDPIALIKWIDYLYGPEGTVLSTIGEEGVTYAKQANGNYEWIGEFKEAVNEKGSQLGAHQNFDKWYGGYYPGFYNGYTWLRNEDHIQAMNELTYNTDQGIMDNFQISEVGEGEEYSPEVLWPSFSPNEDEKFTLGEIHGDLFTYLAEMRGMFVSGRKDIDKDWDEYIDQLKALRLDEYIKIKQKQLDRYNQS